VSDGVHLVHLCSISDWLEARSSGVLEPESLTQQGFVHLSERTQVHIPANLLYRDHSDLVLLSIDPQRVGGEIVWEDGDPPSDDGMQFPHLYDTLPTSAVIGVERYEMDDSGRYPQLN
jgi:uncharacterized protein (DUF952 family)